jgi:hypothetical protein
MWQTKTFVVFSALVLCAAGAWGQAPAPLSSNQLDDLVAPIALYPDPLLSQVLVASTYPLEIVEAAQWLQRNAGLTGSALTSSAQQQNWDPSVQALVVFPDLLRRLSEDVTWLTNLGNAFLTQQADVMDAVQRARVKAQDAELLNSTPQQTVTTTTESGRQVVTIMPAQPNVIYVPVYDPVWIWGPYVYWPYPRWHYPLRPRIGVVVIWSPPIIINSFLPGPWFGWGAWGWYPAWTTHVVMFNNVFVGRYHFNPRHIAAFGGPAVWTHDPFHRQGVPYSNRLLTERYRAGTRENLRSRIPFEARPAPPSMPQRRDRIGNREIPANPPDRNRGVFDGIENGGAARRQSDRGNSSLGGARPAPNPSRRAPTGRQTRR